MGRTIMAGGAPKMTVPSKPSNLPEIGTPLNDMTWADIRAISDAGLASSYFNVGDRKAVTLNGTVGNLSLNGIYYCYIIGIDHNSAIEGTNRIHFQLGKTELSGGTDVALCDSSYGSYIHETGYFSMNSSNTNSGGWASSQMRTNICGTSLMSYSGTIIEVIPAELRAVLKPVTKYTNNTGQSSEASAVTATTDYFFILSEYEVFGSCSRANKNEASKQAQYAYYSAGNSKIKYSHREMTKDIMWWLRSASPKSQYFVIVYKDGSTSFGEAHYSAGFAPAFCV